MFKNIKPITLFFIFLGTLILLPFLIFLGIQFVGAFVGPSQAPPGGRGAIDVDVSGNIGVGTSAAGTTKFLITGTSTNTFGFRVLQSDAVSPVLITTDAGRVGVATGSTPLPAELTVQGNLIVSGNITAGSITGGGSSGPVSARNVTAGLFGADQGGGNYSFPAFLGIATTTQVGLPQELSVYGKGYFSNFVGIGTTIPASALHVAGSGNYIQLDATSTTPGTTDCDAASEEGRMKFNATGDIFYVCSGASGWVGVNTYAP